MKYFTFLIITFFSVFAYSQVGIGTAFPESSLDIRAANHLGNVSASDGVLVPRVNDLSTAGSTDGQLVYLTSDVSTFTKGFHYWDDALSAWTPINSTIEPWNRAGTNNPATLNTDNLYTLGQVGIGTNNPLGALHITTENSRDVLFLRFIDGLDDDLDLDLFRSLGSVASPGLLPDNTRLGGVRGQSLINASTYAFRPSAEIYFESDGASSATSSSGKIKFATTPAGALSTVDRMVIRENGFIGIGTNDPVERIEIKRAGDNDMQFTSASTNPPNVIFYNTGGSLDSPGLLGSNQEIGSVVFKTNNGSSIREVGGVRMFMDGTPTASSLPTKLVFNTTPAGAQEQTLDPAAMTIDNAGMVGIGVSDPQAKLDIAGNIKIVDGTQGADKVLTSDANGVASWKTPLGARQTVYRTQPRSAANGTTLPTTGLIELEGYIRMTITKETNDFYSTEIQNIFGSSINVTVVSGMAGQSIETSDFVEVAMPNNSKIDVDDNGLTFWEAQGENTEILTADIILPNGSWYEMQWFAFEKNLTKQTFMTAIKKY
ncbi:hypothetical protein AAU57_09225 [Nonlabens sp. YIK11]|uniref:hypothetical protein n=1 Tax=Nonlabens sp. YIK11 TaxID=1453349 RepID=UPI0006DBEBDD|nr:hypothetical protein [Nonlabens sp. YIK11]KQC33472.1 hypothetical protein AAU57_09225 [Nonlabens sp. YIK11]